MTKPILRPRSGAIGCDAFRDDIEIHSCRGCGTTSATYPGHYPKGWGKVAGHDFCRPCRRRVER